MNFKDYMKFCDKYHEINVTKDSNVYFLTYDKEFDIYSYYVKAFNEYPSCREVYFSLENIKKLVKKMNEE